MQQDLEEGTIGRAVEMHNFEFESWPRTEDLKEAMCGTFEITQGYFCEDSNITNFYE